MAVRRNRYWVWFFVIVGVLTLGAVVTLIAYNLGQQLKPEQLAAARKLWEQHGPADYDLFYKVQRQGQGGESEDEYVIKVRHGRVVYGTLSTAPRFKQTPLPTRLYATQGVPAFFDFLDDYLTQDKKPGAGAPSWWRCSIRRTAICCTSSAACPVPAAASRSPSRRSSR